MPTITAIITAYRRPDNIQPLVKALREQTVRPRAIWVWANDPSQKLRAILAEARLDRVVTSSDNAYFHGRFALALLAESEFVAIFDDDSIPGKSWFANCLETMGRTPGILGTAGVVLHEAGYAKRSMHGWQRPSDETVEVDLVGQAWFLRTEWVKHLFALPPVTGTNGEDIELAARAWRLAGIRSYCPPHPAGDMSRWGSTRGFELGVDDVAASLRVDHLAVRKKIVEAEIAAGWLPLCMRSVDPNWPSGANRGEAFSPASERAAPAGGMGEIAAETQEVSGRGNVRVPRWVAEPSAAFDAAGQASPSHLATLRIEGLDEANRCNLDCLAAIESLGGRKVEAEAINLRQFDHIDCSSALERVRNPLAFLRAARRLLKSRGRLTATLGNARHHSRLKSLMAGTWDDASGSGTLRFFTRREIEKLFYRAGFRAVVSLAPSGNLQASADNRLFADWPGDDAQEFAIERYAIEAAAGERPQPELTSIVIVTHNQLGYTQACLDSIRFVTDEPYELIFVDNGSTDGTLEYLRSCPDVRLIENAENRGFPAAANQGILASRGRHVLLLNNDVIVTTGWLDRLLRPLAQDERIGLVGPLTNCASGYQQIPVCYANLACLDGFAWQRGKQFDGQLQDVDRLIGFCLLIRRKVIDEVGLLDERFGVGNYEDDDYCRRARDAGWRQVVAQDAFIHHFGHRTFEGAGVDLKALLEENAEKYRAKWDGAEQSGGGQPEAGECNTASSPPPPATAPAACIQGLAHSADAPMLSLCMIVRDNARTIRPCLESIRPWVDEMIVVDTGSTDKTPEICRELGAQVYHFPWPDSFAIARNESIKYARGQWLFWMDSDDIIDAENGRKLRDLVNRAHEPNLLGYVMQVHCPGAGAEGAHDVTVVDHLKLFRNRSDLRFEGRIHEQLLDAINRADGDVAFTDVFVVHAGADHTPEGRKRKLKRDLKLLHLDRRERPNHPFVYFNLGMTYADAGKHRKAVKALRRSLELAQPHESQVRKAYALLAASLRELGQKAEAQQASAEGLKLYPKDPELLFRHAMLSHDNGRLREAEQSYLAALANNDALHFSSIDRGIVGFKARHNLAAVYADMGALHKAEIQWRRIIEEVPGYGDGWLGLGENLLLQGKLAEAQETVERIETAAPPRLLGAAVNLTARIAEAAGDHDRALEVLRAAVRQRPDDPEPLRELCRSLFSQGQMAEAQKALSELAEREPDDPAVHHNLGTLLLQGQSYSQAAEQFRASLKHRPDSAMTHLSLGYALRGMGECREAAEEFGECLRLAPDARLAAEAQRLLECPSA